MDIDSIYMSIKARKLIKELIDDGGEKDDKNNPSYADSK